MGSTTTGEGAVKVDITQRGITIVAETPTEGYALDYLFRAEDVCEHCGQAPVKNLIIDCSVLNQTAVGVDKLEKSGEIVGGKGWSDAGEREFRTKPVPGEPTAKQQAIFCARYTELTGERITPERRAIMIDCLRAAEQQGKENG